MDRWVGKVAIVTGVTQGVGAAITVKLLDLGVTVVGLARRQEKLNELAQKCKNKKGKFYPIKADISKEPELLEAFKQIKNIGPVHILVNNAASYQETTLIEGETQVFKDGIYTNILAICVAQREAIKDMRENNIDGHIVHIGSIETYQLPNLNIYIPTKVAVHSLTETLRQELNSIKSKIKVSCINPGTIDTEQFHESNAVLKSEELKKYFAETAKMQPVDIANALVFVLSTPPHVQVHEITLKPVGEVI